ncbi:MAG TPA: hypothetical protein VHL11_09770, partial [Phototrophicaceae bacterium]|nr:hypothetical protein [Phototrophicaceae bacterium]
MNLDDVKRLSLEDDPHTLSLYLDIDNSKEENQATQPAWRIYAKQAVNNYKTQMEEVTVWQPIKARTEAFFESYKPDTKGLAVFFTADDEQIYELPVPVSSGTAFGKPLIAPLLW